jgi:hypothetical protein
MYVAFGQGAAMTTVRNTLGDAIFLDLSTACVDLAEARVGLAGRDSAANRAVVAECEARIDVLLDMLLEATTSSQAMHPHPCG